MPKQGQFARSNRQKVIKEFRHRQQRSSRKISLNMANNFLLVRFNLTSGKQLSVVDRESCQRFLQELMPRLLENDFHMMPAVQEVLKYVNSRVPWQFYYQLSSNWAVLDHFMRRELPVIPLEQKIIVKDPIDQQALDQCIVNILARQITTITLMNKTTDAAVQQALTPKMKATITNGDGINWSTVQALLQPFHFPIDSSLDEGSQKWLEEISQIKA
ncbi:hypothetical protein [Limosilactobacillus coleohominis]|uniref:hypothetical protein n=1 Tax=Limosilactobacillus coleohominis TaxID=181675 RepID=UPI0026F24B9A|nr:hypothetical protein [Limosilactobacillus coleohominis]